MLQMVEFLSHLPGQEEGTTTRHSRGRSSRRQRRDAPARHLNAPSRHLAGGIVAEYARFNVARNSSKARAESNMEKSPVWRNLLYKAVAAVAFALSQRHRSGRSGARAPLLRPVPRYRVRCNFVDSKTQSFSVLNVALRCTSQRTDIKEQEPERAL